LTANNSSLIRHLGGKTKARNRVWFARAGRKHREAPDELVEDAMSGYLAELSQLRNTLDRRYDQIKNGKVQPIDGEDALPGCEIKITVASIHERICTSS
jgi:hypothetical protein